MLYKTIFLVISFSLITLLLSACKPKTQTTQQTQNTQNQTVTKKQDADFQAAFAIFTDDIFRVFTANMYHNQSEKVFISSGNPNLIQVRESPTTWGEFFNSLPMDLSNDCLWTGTLNNLCSNENKTLKFYVNGQKVDDFVGREIKPGDQALISYGAEADIQIKNQISKIPDP